MLAVVEMAVARVGTQYRRIVGRQGIPFDHRHAHARNARGSVYDPGSSGTLNADERCRLTLI